MQVLVVTNIADIRHVLRATLRKLGATSIVDVAKGEDANARISEPESLFDLFVVDNDTPNFSAADFARNLRSDPLSYMDEKPVIAICSALNAGSLKALLDAGVDGVLAKPFSVAQLEARVRAALSPNREFVRTPTYIGPKRTEVRERSNIPSTARPPKVIDGRRRAVAGKR